MNCRTNHNYLVLWRLSYGLWTIRLGFIRIFLLSWWSMRLSPELGGLSEHWGVAGAASMCVPLLLCRRFMWKVQSDAPSAQTCKVSRLGLSFVDDIVSSECESVLVEVSMVIGLGIGEGVVGATSGADTTEAPLVAAFTHLNLPSHPL